MKIVEKLSMNPGVRIRGFTLVELLLALGIAGIIAAFAISISSSISGLSKQAMTKARMETIAAKARQYYRSHKTQVTAATTPAASVPVTSTALNLESKYRLDGWGRFFYYRVSPSISGFKVNGSSARVGVIIISSGPDQGFDIEGYNDPTKNEFIIKGDDLIIGVNFNQEATEITLEELQVLQSKVEAFDAQFEGINNNPLAGGDVDEDGCVADSGTGCPPTGNNDPNCGRATLDNIIAYDCGSGPGVAETSSAVAFIVDRYSLSTFYLTDSWGNPYQWSDPADPLKHHKFWSLGPDGVGGTADDIVF
ncbi:MAG: type II secretion system protein GspG [Deltaproteobacteria bacterium]|nr:type II secretion system protein GspG [Deltaproteobacteria bacterium]